MKIVLISSGTLPVMPAGYGGLEQVIGDLAIELDKTGHDVFVVAPSESNINKHGKIQLIDCGVCTNDAHGWEERAYQKYRPMMDSEEFKDAVWNDHTWGKWSYVAKQQNPKLNVCSTLHGMLPYHTPPPVAHPSFIGISKSHADRISAGLGIPCRVAYNGIDLDKYKFNGGERNNRYLFLARITPFKGTHVFIDAMNQIKGEGDVVGDDVLVEDKGYVERILVACNANPALRYWGGVPRDMAVEFFRNSKAYVLPLTPGWEEPFGLTMVESMACGCPVIVTRSGSSPEIVEHGVTGYVVDHLSDLSSFLTDEKIKAIKPEDCRKQAEKFSRKAMADRYQELYLEVLNGGW